MGLYISGSQNRRFGPRFKKKKLFKQLIWGRGAERQKLPIILFLQRKKIPTSESKVVA